MGTKNRGLDGMEVCRTAEIETWRKENVEEWMNGENKT